MRKFIITFYIISCLATVAWAESNIDFFFQNASQYQDVIIEEVRSADTFILESGEVIKLIGLNAPTPPKQKKRRERDEKGLVVEEEPELMTPIEILSFQYADELLKGKHVRLEFDSLKKDDASKTLAYAFFVDNNTLINTEILKSGFADLSIQPPNMKYVDQLRAAYQEGRREKRGIHGEF